MSDRAVEALPRRNLKLTRYAVISSFTINTLSNIILLGWLSRAGGIELVGIWALVNAVTMNLLILDFGLTNALTHEISKTGVDAVAAVLVKLLGLIIKAHYILIVIIAFFILNENSVVTGILLSLSAGLLQLASNWLISIRMGTHQQYWFNFLTIVRVVVQSAIAVILVSSGFTEHYVSFGAAIFIGSLAMFLVSYSLVKNTLGNASDKEECVGIRSLVAKFALENMSQRAIQPLSQLMVAHTFGAAALGVFTLALRMPVVVNQCVSEALRALLPGFTSILREHDQTSIRNILGEALVTQLVLIVPAAIFLIVNSGSLIELWIGHASVEIICGVRIFTVAMLFSCVAIPYYWAIHAHGGTRYLAYSGSARLMFVLLIGFMVVTRSGNLIHFFLVFGVGQAMNSMFYLYIAHRKYNLFFSSLANINFVRLVCLFSFSLLTNLAFSHFGIESTGSTSLIFSCAVNFLLAGVAVIGLMKRSFLLCPVNK